MNLKEIVVIIFSYDRYENLINILNNLYKYKNIRIVVVDDASNDLRYLNLDNKYKDLVYYRNKYNNGKKYYWETVNIALSHVSQIEFKYLIQLDDDFILCEKFLEKLYGIAKKNNVAAINFRLDDHPRMWLGKDTWVDGGALYYRRFLEFIKFKIDPIPLKRWENNEKLGSGVWQQITHKIHRNNYKILMTEKSLIHHIDQDSKMNETERKNNGLKTIGFDMDVEVYVIMCTWRRVERLGITLECLKKQTYKKFKLGIWNNNYEQASEVDLICNDYKKYFDITINHSEENIGGIGRFYFAKNVYKKCQKIIFVDDDQEFDEKLIEDFILLHTEKSIVSWFAWKMYSKYYDRIRIGNKYSLVDYVGTCGMIIDSAAFGEKGLFDIPKKYQFIEDLWLSYYCKYELGYNLYGCRVGLKSIEDGKNQYKALMPLKEEFYKDLCKQYPIKTEFIYDNILIKINHHYDHIGKVVNGSKNFYESSMLEYIKSIYKSGTIIDVGANIGNHTVYFSKICNADNVISVEPVRDNYEKIEQNIKDNLITNCTLVKKGIGQNHKKYNPHLIQNNLGMSFLTEDTAGTIDVITPFDLNIKDISVLKIDCETMSFEILKAFMPLIRKYNPDVFIEAENGLEEIKNLGFKIIKEFNRTPTYHIKYDNSKSLEPVFILMRTSGRPKFFNIALESIRKQNYGNIVLITHTDDENDKYVQGDIIIKSSRKTSDGVGFYNLYCNKLLDAIPSESGWYHFLDDDDEYYNDNVISLLVEHSKKDCVNIGRMQRDEKTIWPEKWKNQLTFQTECFFMATDHKDKARWWNKRAGDHNYSGQLSKILKLNWIDNLIIARSQNGKGHGERKDLESESRQIKTIKTNVKNLKKVTEVYFVKDSGFGFKAKKGQVEYLSEDLAEHLRKQGKVVFL